jgi:aconitate hydratase
MEAQVSPSMSSYPRTETLRVGGRSYEYFSLAGVADTSKMPYCIKVLLENSLRKASAGESQDARVLAAWSPRAAAGEVSFWPARVLMPDSTSVPAVVDLAAMRDRVGASGGNPARINPRVPVDVVIDHSVIVEAFGDAGASDRNLDIEYERNRERYELLRWAESSMSNFRVVPPGTGIVHQVNMERLAHVVVSSDGLLYPDTLVGTDSHTPMINGLGVLGWGVGGIEAETVMLGHPISLLVPEVVGVRLTGSMDRGTTATDVVLAVTERLRAHGVVAKFVEFFGPALASLPIPTRATISNMSPEYGSTCALFPIDAATIRYLRLTGRPDSHAELVEAYAKANDLWHDPQREASYTEIVDIDLSGVVPSVAGPSRPQDRVSLSQLKSSVRDVLQAGPAKTRVGEASPGTGGLSDGAVVIAAITSCTNTSNPDVMIGAGLLARNAVRRGLTTPDWVKTSLAPGSRSVVRYLDQAGLTPYLEKLGFYVVGFGCTTCIGNSGPLKPQVSRAVAELNISAAAVLSGNRNFDGRINPEVKLNYLASPPLVVAFALAGTVDIDFATDPLGTDEQGAPVFLAEVWPQPDEVADAVAEFVTVETFRGQTADDAQRRWDAVRSRTGERFDWDPASTYIRRPPYLDGSQRAGSHPADVAGARALLVLGDSVTTDHISPAGAIRRDSLAGRYLAELGVTPSEFNSYITRRGNHDVMLRAAFGNPRLRNRLVPDSGGGVTLDPTATGATVVTIYEAAARASERGVPLVVIAGKDYGTGSSRDWAAKGTSLLGIRAVLAESFERIHRSNLIGMGVLPLQFRAGGSAASLGLSGLERFSITGLAGQSRVSRPLTVAVQADETRFDMLVRIDTDLEWDYYCRDGILNYALDQLE